MTAYIYSPKYTLEWADHVFPGDKYRLVAEQLLKEGITRDFIVPRPAVGELTLIHAPAYLQRLALMTQKTELGYREFEVPVTTQVLATFLIATGGTILAALHALAEGAAGNVSGGFHHAFSDRGEGFCLINDLAVAIRVLQSATGSSIAHAASAGFLSRSRAAAAWGFHTTDVSGRCSGRRA